MTSTDYQGSLLKDSLCGARAMRINVGRIHNFAKILMAF